MTEPPMTPDCLEVPTDQAQASRKMPLRRRFPFLVRRGKDNRRFRLNELRFRNEANNERRVSDNASRFTAPRQIL
jgi:hypothetical protein